MPMHAKPGNSGHEDAYTNDKTYAALLGYVAASREAEVRAAGIALKSVASTVRNTVGALKHFMNAAGLSDTSQVGTDLTEDARFEWVLKRISDLGLTEAHQRRVRSEMTMRIRPVALQWLGSSYLDRKLSLKFGDEDSFAVRIQLALEETPHIKPSQAAAMAGINLSQFSTWISGAATPTSHRLDSVIALEKIFGVSSGFFSEKVRDHHRVKSVDADLDRSTKRRYAEHLPENYADLSVDKKNEILKWISENISAKSMINFSDNDDIVTFYSLSIKKGASRLEGAEKSLIEEIDALVNYKTSELGLRGLKRNGSWSPKSVDSYVSHIRMFMGAMIDLGYEKNSLSLVYFCFPGVIDAYIEWRQRRRGAHTRTTSIILQVISSLLRPETGYMFQLERNFCSKWESLARDIAPDDISKPWHQICEAAHKHVRNRLLELRKIEKQGREVFDPILPVLNSPSPISTYMKIVSEIRRRIRSKKFVPVRWAEDVRSISMIRIGLETGFRQKNLRELLLCLPGETPKSHQYLRNNSVGEIYFKDGLWRIFMPVSAFKNKNSSALSGKDVHITLIDRAGLYDDIHNHLESRTILLNGAVSSLFFVKSLAWTRAKDPRFNSSGFYQAYRATIERYGILNPYTGNGAIAGLKPHGPHAIRDVLATHVIKQTSSYERAAAIIMDSVETVKSHYARWMPGEQFELAQRELDGLYREIEASK